MIESEVSAARRVIEAAHSEYAALHNGALIGLSAMQLKDGRIIESLPLLLKWDDIRMRLQSRNRQSGNMAHAYVSGRLKNGQKK